MLAYTDGLVERRGVSIDDGIDRLAELLRDGSELPAAEAADRLLDYLVIPLSATDDIALLLVRNIGVPVARGDRDPGRPDAHARRARSAQDVARRGAGSARSSRPMRSSPSRRRATTRSSTATPGGAGRSSCGSSIEPDLLTFTIEDEGVWRAPEPDPTRGRGTLIMKATMDRTTIAHNGSGTRVELELKPRV